MVHFIIGPVMQCEQTSIWQFPFAKLLLFLYWEKFQCLRNRSALAANCCLIIHCLEVSCNEDQIMSTQLE